MYRDACAAVEPLPSAASDVPIQVMAVRRLPVHGVCSALGSQVTEDVTTSTSDDGVEFAGETALIADGVMRRWTSIQAVYTSTSIQTYETTRVSMSHGVQLYASCRIRWIIRKYINTIDSTKFRIRVRVGIKVSS